MSYIALCPQLVVWVDQVGVGNVFQLSVGPLVCMRCMNHFMIVQYNATRAHLLPSSA
jgi:hypothetical protein